MLYEESVVPEEMALLTEEWGETLREHVVLQVDDPFLSGPQQRLVSNRRRAEICYVMHRGRPADGLLLHIKSIYPEHAYRLPTGGIHQGESVLGTLAREIYEETGLVVGPGADQVQIERFLGLLSYELQHTSLGVRHFATYPFLVRMPADGTITTLDPEEMIAGWQWRAPEELGDVADLLEQVGNREPDWADWGRYRAPCHRFVLQALTV